MHHGEDPQTIIAISQPAKMPRKMAVEKLIAMASRAISWNACCTSGAESRRIA